MADTDPPPLDPDYAAAIAAFKPPAGDWLEDSPEQLRAVYKQARQALRDDAMGACTVEPLRMPDPMNAAKPLVDGLAITPPGARADRAIAYFHGGSWLVGSPETHLVPITHIAAATGLTVYSLRYSLCPEHPFPAQRDDGLRGVAALLAGPIDGQAGPRDLVLMGDSAGAAVIFWIDHDLPESLRRRIAGVVGIYGAFGLLESDSLDRFDIPGSGLSKKELRLMYERLGNPHDLPADSGFNVIETARRDGPPVYLTAAGRDPLLDDSRRLHDRLTRIGRPCTLDVAPALPHGHMHYCGRVPSVTDVVRKIGSWVRSLPD